MGGVKVLAVSLMSLLHVFCKYNSSQLNRVSFESPLCRSPHCSESLWGGHEQSYWCKKNNKQTKNNLCRTHPCRNKSLFCYAIEPLRRRQGACLLIKIAVMLQNRTYVQEQTAHYHPWVTDALQSSMDSKLSSLPKACEQAAMAMLVHSITSKSLWDAHRWRPTGGSEIVPLYGN